jgi:hypothetical protein
MNDRMKEIILEAGFPKFDKMYVVSDGEELEKFAQLIIDECIQVAYAAEKKPEGFLTVKSARNLETEIYTHFGVKQ